MREVLVKELIPDCTFEAEVSVFLIIIVYIFLSLDACVRDEVD